jgi:hypothetical protein
MQRVARHLYRRGNIYTFRRVIPPHARPAFDGLAEYVRSIGDVGVKEADHLAAQHRAHCDRLMAAAAKSSHSDVGVRSRKGRGSDANGEPDQRVPHPRSARLSELEVCAAILNRFSQIGTPSTTRAA